MSRNFLQKFNYSLIKYVTLKRVMKAQSGSRGIALLFLQPRCWIGMGGQRHAPADLPTEITKYLLYWRIGGPQDRSGLVRRKSPSTGIRSPDCPTRSVVAILTELRRSLHKIPSIDLTLTIYSISHWLSLQCQSTGWFTLLPFIRYLIAVKKGKVFSLQYRCGPKGG